MRAVRLLSVLFFTIILISAAFSQGESDPRDVELISVNDNPEFSVATKAMKGPRMVAGMDTGSVMLFDGNQWQALHLTGLGSPVKTLSVQWRGERMQPRVVVGLSNSNIEYFDGEKWHELLANKKCYDPSFPRHYPGHIVSMSVQWGDWPKIIAGLQCGLITYYDRYKWKDLHNSGWTAPAYGLSVNWKGEGVPKMAVGLGQYDSKTPGGAVEYFDGKDWSELQGTGWAAGVNQLNTLWPESGKPWLVVGLGQFNEGTTAGAVEYYNGSGWRELHGTGWTAPVNQMSTRWKDSAPPQVVVGLGQYDLHTAGGAVEYYDGDKWQELMGTGWLAPVTHMSVGWQGDSNPRVLVGLGQYQPNSGGAVEYYNGNTWTELHDANWLDGHVTTGVTQVSADWIKGGNPRAIIALGKVYPIIIDTNPPRAGEVQFYTGQDWVQLHDSNWNSVINALDVHWASYSPSEK